MGINIIIQGGLETQLSYRWKALFEKFRSICVSCAHVFPLLWDRRIGDRLSIFQHERNPVPPPEFESTILTGHASFGGHDWTTNILKELTFGDGSCFATHFGVHQGSWVWPKPIWLFHVEIEETSGGMGCNVPLRRTATTRFLSEGTPEFHKIPAGTQQEAPEKAVPAQYNFWRISSNFVLVVSCSCWCRPWENIVDSVSRLSVSI